MDEDGEPWDDELEVAVASFAFVFDPLTAPTIALITISAPTPISTQNHHLLVTGFFGATVAGNRQTVRTGWTCQL